MTRAIGVVAIVACAACGTHGVDVDSAPKNDASVLDYSDADVLPAQPLRGADAGPPESQNADTDAGRDGERDNSDAAPARRHECDDASECASGFCVGGSCCAQPCDAPPVCNEAAPIGCADGASCVYAAARDGSACDDGDPCTRDDACMSGSCSGTSISCDDADACTLDACDPAAGECRHTAVACDDGDICTADVCDPATGACSHETVICDDGNACTDDACDPVQGCVAVNNHLACDDADPCTAGDVCSGGACVGTGSACDDGDPCTTDLCDPSNTSEPCQHQDNTAPCEDGDSCTTGDRCGGGSCRPGARDACGAGQISCTSGSPNVCECEPPYEDDAGRCAILPPIPDPPANCPVIATGMITVLGQEVAIWVGEQEPGVRGPIYFYWHGTGGDAIEAALGIGDPAFEMLAQGGVIASFTTSTGTGTNTGNGVWYTGDFAMADQILACAKQQLNIDTTRIYTGGCSAGGLQASAMAYRRSSYLAAAAPNSGGVFFPFSFEDPAHVPAVITAHGAAGVDVVGLDFSTTSLRFANDLADAGGFAVDCDHGGQHCAITPELQAAHWQFLQEHPYGVAPEPYGAGLPASFPAYCTIIE